jgi:hypothetical protein
MRRVKVIYLVREGQDPRWRQSFVEVFGDKHDSRFYDRSRPIEPQFADVEVVVDRGGASMTAETRGVIDARRSPLIRDRPAAPGHGVASAAWMRIRSCSLRTVVYTRRPPCRRPG